MYSQELPTIPETKKTRPKKTKVPEAVPEPLIISDDSFSGLTMPINEEEIMNSLRSKKVYVDLSNLTDNQLKLLVREMEERKIQSGHMAVFKKNLYNEYKKAIKDRTFIEKEHPQIYWKFRFLVPDSVKKELKSLNDELDKKLDQLIDYSQFKHTKEELWSLYQQNDDDCEQYSDYESSDEE